MNLWVKHKLRGDLDDLKMAAFQWKIILVLATARTLENVERVCIAINENCCLTVQELEEDYGISKTIISEMLTQDLRMSRKAAKFVPQLLTQLQSNYGVKIDQNNLEMIRK